MDKVVELVVPVLEQRKPKKKLVELKIVDVKDSKPDEPEELRDASD